MPSRTDTNRRSELSSRKDDRDRDRNRKDQTEKTHSSSEHNSNRKHDTIKSSQNSSSRRSSPPKHSLKDRPKVEDDNDRRTHHRPDKSTSSLRASISQSIRNKDGNRHEAKKTETLKRPRSKSPPTHRHHTDRDTKHRRTDQESPVKKSERKEIVVKKEEPAPAEGEGFGNSGFGNGGFGNSGFGNSGFGNTGFGNGGFGDSSGNFNNKTSYGRREHNNEAGKPRIAGPNDGFGTENSNQQSGFKMVIVNELSMDSIKKEENPLKGTMTTKRTRGGGPFIGQRNALGRGGGNQNSFGMARGPTAGFGARGGFNNSGRPNFDRTAEPPNPKDVRYSSSRNAINEHGDGAKSIDSDEKPPLNPLAVPRGRNYFLHDHRDAIADDNRLYDPRLDRGGSSFRRGTGNRERGGGRRGPPMGWRNFEGATDGNEKESGGAFYRRGGRGGFTRGGGFAGNEPATDGSRPSWRSKADEDRVWKHDKYMEITQEEVDTKLELVDEADGEQTMDDGSKEGRQRYQEDEYLEYETEEMVPYD